MSLASTNSAKQANPVRRRAIDRRTILNLGLMANGADDSGWNDSMRLINGMVEQIDAGDERGAAASMVVFWFMPGMYRSLPSDQREKIATGMRFAVEKGRKVSADPAAYAIDATAIAAPTLVLSGAQSPLAAQGVSNVLASSIRDAEFRRIDGVGDMAPFKPAAQINPLIEAHVVANAG